MSRFSGLLVVALALVGCSGQASVGSGDEVTMPAAQPQLLIEFRDGEVCNEIRSASGEKVLEMSCGQIPDLSAPGSIIIQSGANLDGVTYESFLSTDDVEVRAVDNSLVLRVDHGFLVWGPASEGGPPFEISALGETYRCVVINLSLSCAKPGT